MNVISVASLLAIYLDIILVILMSVLTSAIMVELQLPMLGTRFLLSVLMLSQRQPQLMLSLHAVPGSVFTRCLRGLPALVSLLLKIMLLAFRRQVPPLVVLLPGFLAVLLRLRPWHMLLMCFVYIT